jgi:hypothetical protein
MSHVEFGSTDLERLDAERRAEERRASLSTSGIPTNP